MAARVSFGAYWSYFKLLILALFFTAADIGAYYRQTGFYG